jgi:hypothetical protein
MMLWYIFLTWRPQYSKRDQSCLSPCGINHLARRDLAVAIAPGRGRQVIYGIIMAHRDTDTEKWDDSWFQGLPLSSKLLWMYLCDKCDWSGVWKENRSLAEFQIGTEIPWDEVLKNFSDRITIIRDRWFITGFIKFHFGDIKPSHKMSKKICECLDSHKIRYTIDSVLIVYLNENYTLSESQDTLKDKDKSKDKDNSYDLNNKNNTNTIGENSASIPEGNGLMKLGGVDWDSFKAAYPSGHGEHNPEAEQAFLMLSEAFGAEIIISGAKAYDSYCRLSYPDYPNSRFIRQVFNWLKSHEWKTDWINKINSFKKDVKKSEYIPPTPRKIQPPPILTDEEIRDRNETRDRVFKEAREKINKKLIEKRRDEFKRKYPTKSA